MFEVYKMKNLWIMVIIAGMLIFPAVSAYVSNSDLDVTLLSQYPDPERSGDVMEIRVSVQNNGEAYGENIIVEVVPEYPFSIVPGTEKRQEIRILPHWPVNANYQVLDFKVLVNKEAIDGSQELKVKYSTSGGQGWSKKTFLVDVTSKEFAEIIYIDKTKLIPGKETELVFTINNIGNAPLQNMVFSWSEPDHVVLPVNTDNTRYIKYLAPDDKIPLKYTVIASVNAVPDLYELTLNLEYDVKDEDGSTVKEVISTQAGVFVGGETDFDVAFSESSNGETSFSIANIGSNPAYSVSVIIPKQEGWRITGSNSRIIGNLNKGDYTIASFKLQPAVSETGEDRNDGTKKDKTFFQDSQTIKVQVVYTDTMGKRSTVEKEVQLDPQSLMGTEMNGEFSGKMGLRQKDPGFFSKYKWFIIIIVIVLFVFIYKKYKKRKNRNLGLFGFVKEGIKSIIKKIKK
jgi:hypothetical protein